MASSERQSLARRRNLLRLIFLSGALGVAFLAASALPDAVIYNASPSMPQGFYTRTNAPVVLGSIVTVRARDVALAYASARHFTDANDRFLKRVAALSGDMVCARDGVVIVNRTVVAERRALDSSGRALPAWSGCRRLADEVLLIGNTADSFDGRYWGPIATRQVEGVWRRVR